ncbi:MAG: ATP synthase F0 subunit A [Candidatus Abyssobacteria bacterium SURF_17]|uniref:ATP synthase subunit a n=1 Tax=Candidatus Abyssobacteria bacterium SURF_17 TaxID=2093361 RepID=A0A419EPK2_9BACT|nr:MAG: ATP synthase F0 subunit A [Candidatus Abyssubacteria bacterium SURF_17]
MFVAAFVAFVVLYLSGKRAMVPGRSQGFMEMVLTLIREKMVLDTMGHEGLPFFPLIASLFFFVFFCNIVGIFPLGHYGFTATSNVNVTGTLAVMVFVIVIITGIRKKGALGYLKSFAPHGVPVWLLPLIFPVEVISLFAKHFALAVRLFANMFAGHMVILVFATLTATLLAQKSLLTALLPLPFAGVVVMLIFEIFVALIQAFIFAILTSLYIGDSLREHH